ncbi:MAG: hypothetical protein H0W65_00995 [Sphingomonas sp.]|uniref:hypothetical protein n=1 Tax=Sphingomonas sp. TaxID=28214 RepID=UPI00185E1740|nr:hypothetical protein [Sphingomonas sp.]MBA3666288.1 hypothetical protein [Sphingomonas sp.]
MRLIDRVVNASQQIELTDGTGQSHVVTGVGAKSATIKGCELRYILDRTASDECMKLVLNSNNGLLSPDNSLLRLPAETFWIEWFGMAPQQFKSGMLVETAENGRRGLLTGYFQSEHDRADKVGACVEFDLDGLARSGSSIGMTHANCAHLNDLLSCAYLHLDPSWHRYFRARPVGTYDRTAADVAEHCWYFLPMACAFAAMLNSPDILVETRSNLERLNLARKRRGNEPLLDHIEVSMRLGQYRANAGQGDLLHQKNSPRLHHVRGHFVHRAGKTFWRSAHLRGDAERPITQKTVSVRGADRSSPSRVAALSQLG